MYYSHKFITGNYTLMFVSLDGRTGNFIDMSTEYKIEQTFLMAYMSEMK